MVTKNAEFDADFESVEKEARSLYKESYRLPFCTKYWKVKKYIHVITVLHFRAKNFFEGTSLLVF